MTKEDPMPKRKGKAPSFDAMVKFFMRQYNIPTKKDVDRLMVKLDRLENLIKRSAMRSDHAGVRIGRYKTAMTAIDIVLDAIKRSKQGIDFAAIQANTGFDEKKIRNIIFRLNKTGKIKRKSRGIYIAA
jgi:D-serine deaminase-like pyridoxal phosphate-dependent protein